jgi:hypothetical protein
LRWRHPQLDCCRRASSCPWSNRPA